MNQEQRSFSFHANPFGLHEMHGNLWQWFADPWHANYEGAPSDARVWEAGGNERYRVVRGGSWRSLPFNRVPQAAGRGGG